MRILVVIPTFNEKENIKSLAENIFSLIPESYVLVIDDNSPDGTSDAVREAQNRFPNLTLYQRLDNKGFGKSYLDGFRRIVSEDSYQIVVMMDADFSHDPGEILEMARKLFGYDVVIGSRYTKGGKIENWNWRRRLLSRFANFYVKVILGSPINDMTSGFIAFRKDVLGKVNLDSIKSEGYAFLVEFKYKISKAGYKIFEHPIIFSERREGQSKMSFRNIWEAVFLPWKLKFSK